MTFELRSPNDAIAFFERVFEEGNGKATLEIREEQCFSPSVYLKVGDIEIHPTTDEKESETAVLHALRFGAFTWTVPDHESVMKGVTEAFAKEARSSAQKNDRKEAGKVRRAIDVLVDCAVRCGFVNPTFDSTSVSEMPFERPTTVVVDTSAIHQGGLDFVVRYLYPMARIKIPAIAHMEILNQAERYLQLRRSEKPVAGPTILLEHALGQGGQRVLLRLELHTDAEIERPRLGADPLRGIVQPDHDAEDKALGLQQIQRSFADRLILETAIQHRDRLSPDHPIVVLTADQGLARMTMGEGLHPLFFSRPPADAVCGTTLSGTCFRPFIEDPTESPYFCISLPELIWELASTFGCARLSAGGSEFSVVAIGENLSWYPCHSRDDLLWTTTNIDLRLQNHRKPKSNSDAASKSTVENGESQSEPRKTTSDRDSGSLKGSYRFPLQSLLKLLSTLERKERVSDLDGMQVVNLSSAKRYAELRNFLLAGKLVTKDQKGRICKTTALDSLVASLRGQETEAALQILLNVPSFNAFVTEVSGTRPIKPASMVSIAQNAVKTYTSVGEICGAVIEIPDEGLYSTRISPDPASFAAFAVKAYRKLRREEEYVLTGAWLEELARTDGIHPICARNRLSEAREAGYLERFTEGSTPETQFERHNICVLETSTRGALAVRNVNLYHGDFLIPGKASVSIRIEDARK